MQSKENLAVDARPFSEIWGKLTDAERSELRFKLYVGRCCSTHQTVWNWGTGRTRPTEPLVRDKVAKVVSDFLGVRVLPITLFPTR